VSPDAAFVAHVLLGDSVAAAWWEAVLAASGHEAVSAVAQRLFLDRRRMADFGCAYVSARLPTLDDGQRAAVAFAIAELVTDVLVRPELPPVAEAAVVAAAAALGLPPVDVARRSVAAAVADVVSVLGRLGLAVPSTTEAGLSPRTST
jgi:hypothetical protein